MTELAQHAPADQYGEQLELDIQTGTADVVVPVDISGAIEHSPAYARLVELRDDARAPRRSGARAIAREAFTALREGGLSKTDFDELFTPIPPQPRATQFEELSTERPSRELDHAERAAGEGVRHPWDEDN